MIVPFKVYTHSTVQRNVIRSCFYRNGYKQHTSEQSKTMSLLMRKIKIVVDKANKECYANTDIDDECLFAWNELDELVEHYTLLSKEMQIKKKNGMNAKVNNNDWDVIH